MRLKHWLALLSILLITAAVSWTYKNPLTAKLLNYALQDNNITISCVNWTLSEKRLYLQHLCISTPNVDATISSATLTFKHSIIQLIQRYRSILNNPEQWPNVQVEKLSLVNKRSLSTFLQSETAASDNTNKLDTAQLRLINSQWQKAPAITIADADIYFKELPNNPINATLHVSGSAINATLLDTESKQQWNIKAARSGEIMTVNTHSTVSSLKALTSLADKILPTQFTNTLSVEKLFHEGELTIELKTDTNTIDAKIDINNLKLMGDAHHLEILNQQVGQPERALPILQTWQAIDAQIKQSQRPNITTIQQQNDAETMSQLTLTLNSHASITHHLTNHQTDVSFTPQTTIEATLSPSAIHAMVELYANQIPPAWLSALPIDRLAKQSWQLTFPKSLRFAEQTLIDITGPTVIRSIDHPTSTQHSSTNSANIARPATDSVFITEALFITELTASIGSDLGITGTLDIKLPLNKYRTETVSWDGAKVACQSSFEWQNALVTLLPSCAIAMETAAFTTKDNQKIDVSSLTLEAHAADKITLDSTGQLSSMHWSIRSNANVVTNYLDQALTLSLTSKIGFGDEQQAIHLADVADIQHTSLTTESSISIAGLPPLQLVTSGTINNQQFALSEWQTEIYPLLPFVQSRLPDSFIIRSGGINTTAIGHWTPDALNSSFSLNSYGVTGEFDGILFAEASHKLSGKLSTETNIASGKLKTSPLQLEPLTFAIGLVDSGVLTSNIHGKIAASQNQVNDGFSLLLEDMKGELLGGNFSLSSGTIYPSLSKEWNIKLDELSLAELVPPSDKFKMTVTGKVSGDIPVELLASGPIVKQGKLRNISNGEIRIHQNATVEAITRGNERVSQGMNYLSNLQFTELRCEVTMTEDATVLLKTHVVGKNPDLDQAIELNYNHEQNFFMWLKLLRAGERMLDMFTNQQ